MKVHQVEVFNQKRYEIDPQKGAVLKHDQIIKRGTAQTVAHGDETFEIEADGSFEVPDELGTFLCGTPGWYEGPNPFVEEYESEGDEDEAPAKPAKRSRAKKAS